MNLGRIGIYGAGLIGCSIAARARGLGAFVTAVDRRPESVAEAQRLGFIDAIAPDLVRLAAESDIVVIATPVDAALDALGLLAERSHPDGLPNLVIDVASVKAPFAGLDVPNYVPTHPFAGSERSGPGAADPDLFEGRPWAYVPPSNPALEERAVAFISALGGVPIAVEAQRHDEIAAVTSHLPQLLSVALGVVVGQAQSDALAERLAGSGLRSMLRLGRSNSEMWAPILAHNSGRIVPVLRNAAATLSRFAEALDEGEIAQLSSYFADARRTAGVYLPSEEESL